MKEIKTKDDFFKTLRSNEAYTSILKALETKEERQNLINTVEYVTGNLFDALSFVTAQMNSNPEAEKQILDALKTGEGIIKESDGSVITPPQTTKEPSTENE